MRNYVCDADGVERTSVSVSLRLTKHELRALHKAASRAKTNINELLRSKLFKIVNQNMQDIKTGKQHGDK